MPAAGLSLRFLGEMQVVRDGAALDLPASKKTRALLAYLAVTGRAHRRERLCALFWEMPHDPRGELRWSLSKLRSLLDEPGRSRIRADRETVALDADGIEIDLLALRSCTARGLDDLSTETLKSLAAAFRGPFLEDLDLPNLPDFQAWCVAEREDARGLQGRLLRTLLERLSGAAEEAIPFARALAQVEPFDGRARESLIRLLLAAGRRAEAEQQLALAERATAELGALPGLDLARLRQTLRTGPRLSGRAAAAEPPRSAPVPDAPGDRPPFVGRTAELPACWPSSIPWRRPAAPGRCC